VAGAWRALCLILLAAVLAATACSSPEATRTRNGGPGGDVGNRADVPDLHGSVNPYFRTPSTGRAIAQ
jgi:hypothetical protein